MIWEKKEGEGEERGKWGEKKKRKNKNLKKQLRRNYNIQENAHLRGGRDLQSPKEKKNEK
jgi:hypothetical protein